MTCYFAAFLIGLLVIVGILAALNWSLRTGKAYGGKPSLVFIERADNPVGFWSALVVYVLFGVVGLSLIWMLAAQTCHVMPIF